MCSLMLDDAWRILCIKHELLPTMHYAFLSSCQLCSCELCCLPLRTYVAILYICLGSETRHQNVSRQQAGYRCKQCSVVLTVERASRI